MLACVPLYNVPFSVNVEREMSGCIVSRRCLFSIVNCFFVERESKTIPDISILH